MRIFRFFANAAFIFGALLILNSCEVGLGESVDVTAPVLEISSPADGSIIMNTFKMRGVGYDDTNIALIKVSVNRHLTERNMHLITPQQMLFQSSGQ